MQVEDMTSRRRGRTQAARSRSPSMPACLQHSVLPSKDELRLVPRWSGGCSETRCQALRSAAEVEQREFELFLYPIRQMLGSWT